MFFDYGCGTCRFWKELRGAGCHACHYFLITGERASRQDGECLSKARREYHPLVYG